METPGTSSRRAVVTAAGAVGLSAALAGCAGADEDSRDPAEAPTKRGTELAKTSEIAEGGGTVFREEKVVVAQPTPGEFVAYSAVCTHAGCLVSAVRDGGIVCDCHGSTFDVRDGSVRTGPAQRPLPAVTIDVKGDSVRLG